MLRNIDSLSVLFAGNRKPDHENIRQRLSDGFHCPVIFDIAAAFAAYSQSIANNRYDIIIADDTPEELRPEEILRSAVASGIPVIFLLETIDMSAVSALLDMGAAGFICRNDPEQLVSEVLKALLSTHRQASRYISNDNALPVQEILDNFTDAIYVVDHAWRVAYINHKVEKCWNCKRDDMIGKVLWDCFPHIAQLPDRDMHEIAMRDRIAVQWETSSPDKAIWAAISTYPTCDGGVAVSFRDITENKHAETVLRLSADQNKNDFIHSLSHELRNPLASIVAGLSMLDILDSNPDTENARSIIKRQTDQLCHLADDLLNLTRITNNKIQMNMERFDLGELTRTSVYDVRLPIPSKPVSTGIVTMEEAEINMKPLKILLIDDNRDLAELTCSLLMLCGYDAVSSYSGLDGIQKAKEFMPHVIICDIGLPDINGYEVARRISDSGDLGNACFISLSGYAQASNFDESREAGFALHICKPVDFDKLKSILESIAQKLIV